MTRSPLPPRKKLTHVMALAVAYTAQFDLQPETS